MVNDSTAILIDTHELQDNYYDLESKNLLPSNWEWSEQAHQAGYNKQMPNLDRIQANGDPLYASFVDYFGDDVSRNQSKSWNKHRNAHVTHWNLPRKLLQQEFHTHFISTSPNASIPKQFHEFKKTIE
ncbi:hypothetical protein PHLCEN_2v6443 [Hermanssonia centrifuga]|uniref:Uncharacterized protein n=1 Tax=Hermanssonia centrifuga TaxID=98765 RepID=A0A2R6NZE1_9APHY|nr:hypothetical protein PHLCEN_2v6443 [Hermanssonia centrifuga]